MTRASCPGCRLRFSGAIAANLPACPFCGEPLDHPTAEAVVGFQLVVAPRPGGVTDIDGLLRAVADAARKRERRR
jgi:hypothetical protein